MTFIKSIKSPVKKIHLSISVTFAEVTLMAENNLTRTCISFDCTQWHLRLLSAAVSIWSKLLLQMSAFSKLTLEENFWKNKWFTQFKTETEDNVWRHMMPFVIVYETCPPPKSRSDKSVLTYRIFYHSHSSWLMLMMIHACWYFIFLIITPALQAIIYEILPSLSCKREDACIQSQLWIFVDPVWQLTKIKASNDNMSNYILMVYNLYIYICMRTYLCAKIHVHTCPIFIYLSRVPH